ncbi:class I SAM-dependent methyltransferase [Candidatus Woesearchaeota archaeon]|nr:class I SAM-dependent methyltransferase [Candidatus Woesearchaeota archaeon]
MAENIRERIAEAVAAESKSRDYAERFYDAESSMDAHFRLDTALLDSILPGKGSLFDAMMARGRHVLYFAGKGFDVYGNDYNRHMVEFVRKDLKAAGLKAKLYNLDVTCLDGIRDNSFDYVICMYSSLGCIPGNANRQKAMREFARVTKPGGLVVVHAHSPLGTLEKPGDLLWLLRDLFCRPGGLEKGDCYYYHGSDLGNSYVHAFRPDELEGLFRNAALAVVIKFYLSFRQGKVASPLLKWLSGGFVFVGRKRQG